MKKFLLSLVLLFISTALAQTAGAPKLTTKEPSFMGFTGSFMKFGSVSGGGRPFTMLVEYKPWFFELSGVANAGHNTSDLDYLSDDIVVILAYYDALGKTSDGTTYQAGIFDFMLYLDDAPIKVSNLKITLKGKAEAGSSVLNQAKTWNFEQGKVFNTPKYSDKITKAQAIAIDKIDIQKEQEAEKKRVADSIATEKKRVADSIATEKKRVADSIATEKKRVADSIALEKRRAANLAVREKRWVMDSTAREKKRITDIAAMEKKWIADSTAREKKRAADSTAMAKKRAADSVETRKQWVADSTAIGKKRAADSIATEKKRIADSIAIAEKKRAAEDLAKEEKKKKSQGRKKAVSKRKATTDDEDWWEIVP